jgi:peptide/nickel transport system substrate-binding protein
MKNTKFFDGNRFVLGLILSMTLLSTLVMLPQQMIRAEEEKPQYGGTFVIGLNEDPPTLVGTFATVTTMQYCVAKVHAGLLYYDYDLNPIPDLAESWEISQDGMTYTFHLVQNATFHDGTPVTSADVKFSWDEVFMVYGTYAATVGIYVDHVETPDAHTVVFIMNQPFAPFITYLPSWFFTILPKHLYEGTDIRNNPYNNAPVGAGPFKFAEWVRGDHLTFTRNENYFRKDEWGRSLPYLDKVVFKIIPDPTTMALAFERGEVDAIFHLAVAANLVSTYLKAPNASVFWTPSAYYSTRDIIFQVQRPIVSNKLVRQAIAHAINRTFLHEIVWQGQGRVNATIGVPSTMEFYFNPNQKTYPYNVTKANELLDLAGYPKGTDGMRFKLKVVYSTAAADVSKEAEIIPEMLKDVGIDVELVATDSATYLKLTYTDWDFDLSLTNMAKGPDPGVTTARFFVSWNQRHISFSNVGYNNSEVDRLFKEFNEATDPLVRQQLIWEAMSILSEDLPMYVIWEAAYPFVYKNTYAKAWTTPWLNERQDETWYTAAQQEAAPSMPWEIYIAIAVVAIIIVVVAVAVLMRRRKKP